MLTSVYDVLLLSSSQFLRSCCCCCCCYFKAHLMISYHPYVISGWVFSLIYFHYHHHQQLVVCEALVDLWCASNNRIVILCVYRCFYNEIELNARLLACYVCVCVCMKEAKKRIEERQCETCLEMVHAAKRCDMCGFRVYF